MDNNRSLKVIPPPADNVKSDEDEDLTSLRLIRDIGRKISEKEVEEFLWEVLEEGLDESVRKIQANRYEIFLHDSANKGTNCIDRILRKIGLDSCRTRKSIIDYAIKQAKKDERLRQKDYKFANFSLIMTYGSADAQAPHIDLLYPNFQCGMLMTDGPGTMWYETEQKVRKVKDLVAAWQRADEIDRSHGHIVDSLTGALIGAMKQSKDVRTLIRGYGNVLLPDEEVNAAVRRFPSLPAGTVMCLPGSVVHAGPKSEHFRAVMFFSAWPQEDNDKVAEYNPDIQYSSVLLCYHLVKILWRQAGIRYTERKYLLEKLYRYIQQGGKTLKNERLTRDYSNHLEWDELTAFIARMERDVSGSREEHMQCIQETAKNEKLTFYNVFPSLDGLLVGDFALVSATGLVTHWKNELFDIQLYQRRSDGKVLVFYPQDGSWEGTEPEECYRLAPIKGMSVEIGQEGWFDGSNGNLDNGAGAIIECFLRSSKSGSSNNKPTIANIAELRKERLLKRARLMSLVKAKRLRLK